MAEPGHRRGVAHFLAPDPAAIVRTAEWLAHRYEPQADHVHFVRVARAQHRTATFLTDAELPAGDVAVVPRAAAIAALDSRAPLNFIFHSAYCCSTLLARALDLPGFAMGLKEPVILNDLSGWRQRGGDPAAVAGRLGDALALLARPFGAGEQVVVKPSNVVNALAPAMLGGASASRALLLHAPLPNFLASIATKGMWGRLWARELFVKLAREGVVDYGFSHEDVLQQTDLQVAAIGWLGQHRLFAAMAARFGDRVRTLDSEVLMANPVAALAALARHFGLGLNDAAIAAMAAGEAFGRNSKTGAAFAPGERTANHRASMAVHGDEVAKVTEWAKAVAASAGQPFVLPSPLL